MRRLQEAFEKSPMNTCAATNNKANRAVLPKAERFEDKCAVCGEGAQRPEHLRLCTTPECFSAYHPECLGLRGRTPILPSCPCCSPDDWPRFVLLTERVHPLQIIKFHMLSHVASAIQLFGALVNTRVAHLEAFHRELKRAFRRCNRTRNCTKQICEFFANRSRMETINMYQYVRAREGLARAQSVLPPPPRNGKRCRASPDADTSAKKRQRQGPAETPTALPRTRPGGSFYNGKGTVVRTLQLQDDTTPIGSCLQFPWGALSLQPPPPLIIRGTSVAEVLHHPLP